VAYKAIMKMHKWILLAVTVMSGISCSTSHAPAQASGGPVQTAQNLPPLGDAMTTADLERLYLSGKISAKQYQKLLNDVKTAPAPVVATPAKPPRTAAVPPAPTTPTPSAVTNAAPPGTNDDKINEVEAKMDELIKAKAAREKATNAPPAQPVVAGPKTKREQLNDLLRQYIEGKITETEMNEKRAKIIAEP